MPDLRVHKKLTYLQIVRLHSDSLDTGRRLRLAIRPLARRRSPEIQVRWSNGMTEILVRLSYF